MNNNYEEIYDSLREAKISVSRKHIDKALLELGHNKFPKKGISERGRDRLFKKILEISKRKEDLRKHKEDLGGEFKEEWKLKEEKIKAFARLFGINPEGNCTEDFYRGIIYTKKEIEKILKDNEIVGKSLFGKIKTSIILKKKFKEDYDVYYHFKKLRDAEGNTRYQLQWSSSVYS